MRREKRHATLKFSNKTITIMLVVLALLNVVDGFSTLYLVSNGFAREVNPLMAMWLEMGAVPFLTVKLFLITLGIGFLWYSRDHKIVHVLTIILLTIYTAIILIHVDIAWTVMQNML